MATMFPGRAGTMTTPNKITASAPISRCGRRSILMKKPALPWGPGMQPARLMQVGRLMAASVLPTSGICREACAPQPYMASLIDDVGPTGSFKPRTGQAVFVLCAILCRSGQNVTPPLPRRSAPYNSRTRAGARPHRPRKRTAPRRRPPPPSG